MTRRFAFYYPRALHGDGGVTNATWLWMESLTCAGAAVDVIYDARLSRNPERQVPSGVELRPVAHRGTGRLAIPTELDTVVDPSAILVLHSGYVMFNLAASAWAHSRRVPYIVMPHGAYDPRVRHRRWRRARRGWEFAEARMLRRAAAVHVFFQPEVAHVQSLAPGSRTITAPTPYEPPDAAWSPHVSDGYVAWLGRYDVQHKGLDRLLDAMSLLRVGDRPRVRLRGRDNGNTRQVVQQLVDDRGLSDQVVVGGPVDGPEKQGFLLDATAYVHPARWDAYGIALVESLALGVPCITTLDVNLGPELAAAQAALVSEGTVPGLATSLAAVSAGATTIYGGRGREFVRKRLSPDSAAQEFLDGLDAVTASATRV